MTPMRLPTSGALAIRLAATVLLPVVAACADLPTDTTSSGTDLATVDDVMTAFMEKYSVPGLSLAITKDERLVYLKAYGRADGGPPSTKDRFRIASVSKPITSVTIMRLVEQGRLSLDQRVFGADAILGTTYGTQPYGAGITSITVDHLLHHTGGGWPNSGGDPMFANPTMSIDQLISWTVDNRPLASTPGSAFAYSNFGFAVLGRVIERVAGKPYANAVKTLVLDPAGITDMAIAGNTLADRQADEVMYFGQNGQNPYGMNLSRTDAAGGWIASAASLAKLLVRVDGFGGKPEILQWYDFRDDHGEQREPRLRRGLVHRPLHQRDLVARGWTARHQDPDRPNRLHRQLQLRDPDQHQRHFLDLPLGSRRIVLGRARCNIAVAGHRSVQGALNSGNPR